MTLVKVGTSYETLGICEGVLTLSDCFPTGSTGKWEVYPEGPHGGGTVIENRFTPMVDNGSQQKNDAGEKRERSTLSGLWSKAVSTPLRKGVGMETVAGEF